LRENNLEKGFQLAEITLDNRQKVTGSGISSTINLAETFKGHGASPGPRASEPHLIQKDSGDSSANRTVQLL